MNLDDLDFEWFIATHAAIEGYFEQINSELVLDTVQHFYIIHNGYSVMLTDNTAVGMVFTKYILELSDCKCNTTLDNYR